MLSGLESIPAAAILGRLALLKHCNARGSHIYIRPSGEHRFTTLDDLNEASLARLSADGFTPCAVVETSAGNFQAWLKHSRMFPKLLGTFAAQTCATRLFEVRTCPKASSCPFRRFCPVALGVGRDGTTVGQACTASSGQIKRNVGYALDVSVRFRPYRRLAFSVSRWPCERCDCS
jgi:hypothetical protein